MNIQESNEMPVDRKKFLQTLGTVFAGAIIAILSAIFISRTYAANNSTDCDGTIKKVTDCSGCLSSCPLKD